VALLPAAEVRRRLELVFPESVPDRGRLTRELAAKTILTFLFVGAVGDPDSGVPLLRPSMVTWMDDSSLARDDDADFVRGWHGAASKRQSALQAFLRADGIDWDRWYADNSREPIRDEIIRPLSERYGAVLRRRGVAASDASPALALASDFAAIFAAAASGSALIAAIETWQAEHLSGAEQVRLAARRRLDPHGDVVTVDLPGRGNRRLPPGLSSVLTASVITDFAPRLLLQPYALAICHSRDPVATEDQRELEQVGLGLDRNVALPDVLLLDVANGTFWFVEIVITGGPIHERRRDELMSWAEGRGILATYCRFVSAYRSRTDRIFRATVGELAWNAVAWFADEPDKVFRLDELAGHPVEYRPFDPL
jgi:hypothetical protein